MKCSRQIFFQVLNSFAALSFQKKNNFLFLYLMANNQLNCGIILEKIAMRPGNDEQIITYEWLDLSNRKQFVTINGFNSETQNLRYHRSLFWAPFCF